MLESGPFLSQSRKDMLQDYLRPKSCLHLVCADGAHGGY